MSIRSNRIEVAEVTLTYRDGHSWTGPVYAYPDTQRGYAVTMAAETRYGATPEQALEALVLHIERDFATPPFVSVRLAQDKEPS